MILPVLNPATVPPVHEPAKNTTNKSLSVLVRLIVDTSPLLVLAGVLESTCS